MAWSILKDDLRYFFRGQNILKRLFLIGGRERRLSRGFSVICLLEYTMCTYQSLYSSTSPESPQPSQSLLTGISLTLSILRPQPPCAGAIGLRYRDRLC